METSATAFRGRTATTAVTVEDLGQGLVKEEEMATLGMVEVEGMAAPAGMALPVEAMDLLVEAMDLMVEATAPAVEIMALLAQTLAPLA